MPPGFSRATDRSSKYDRFALELEVGYITDYMTPCGYYSIISGELQIAKSAERPGSLPGRSYDGHRRCRRERSSL
jgi:hypothetical protein